MTTPPSTGRYLNLYLSEETLRRIERYRYEAELANRTAAIRALLAKALDDAGIPRMRKPKKAK